jgi:hypothetical protein
MDITLWPLLANSIGNEPTTSPKPPVFEYGAHSVETKTIFIGLSATSGTTSGSFSTFVVVVVFLAETTVVVRLLCYIVAFERESDIL